MTEAIILICTLGVSIADCNIRTALEVNRNVVTTTRCVYSAMPLLGADPRASNQVYSKVICNGR